MKRVHSSNSEGGGFDVKKLLLLGAAALLLASCVNVSEPNSGSPPNWLFGYPAFTAISATGFTLQVRTDIIAKAYYVILSNGAPSLTSPGTVKNGGITGALAEGSADIPADTLVNVPIGSLQTNTTYDVYVVADDNKSPAALMPVVWASQLTTANPNGVNEWDTGIWDTAVWGD